MAGNFFGGQFFGGGFFGRLSSGGGVPDSWIRARKKYTLIDGTEKWMTRQEAFDYQKKVFEEYVPQTIQGEIDAIEAHLEKQRLLDLQRKRKEEEWLIVFLS